MTDIDTTRHKMHITSGGGTALIKMQDQKEEESREGKEPGTSWLRWFAPDPLWVPWANGRSAPIPESGQHRREIPRFSHVAIMRCVRTGRHSLPVAHWQKAALDGRQAYPNFWLLGLRARGCPGVGAGVFQRETRPLPGTTAASDWPASRPSLIPSSHPRILSKEKPKDASRQVAFASPFPPPDVSVVVRRAKTAGMALFTSRRCDYFGSLAIKWEDPFLAWDRRIGAGAKT
ncbi:hypothetical protein PG996_004744 [Apiospora saccharicola]|uniref:Uncharacterized protein n=1 Tax=Apiospora saccharicola TaxID=335842 RepID=A0ABR1W8R5_9PEZI